MFDARLRPIIDPPLDHAAGTLARFGVTANQVTVTGFVLGIAAAALIVLHMTYLALVLVWFNRVCDGLDGAIARINGPTDLGGYLDIVLDFIFYSAIVFAFVLVDAANAFYGALLIFSFIGTGSSFLAYSIFAAKRNLSTDVRGKKSFYYLGGMTEGFETILALSLMCLLPHAFPLIATVFAVMCWITTATRIVWAANTLRD